VESTVDVVVVGAGLAGLSVAKSLTDKGVSVLIVDKYGLGAGASGVPIALINPAAAKQANLSWNAKASMAAIVGLLDQTKSHSSREFFRKSGVLRPSVDAATLEAFSSSMSRHNYPSGWAKWLNREELNQFQPDLQHVGGALWVQEAYTVDVSEYLSALASIITLNGAEIRTGIVISSMSYDQIQDIWIVVFSDGSIIRSSKVIKSTGSSILDDPDWGWMPVHRIKGQMALYRSNHDIDWSHAIAARGYVAHLNGRDWVIGSTFEHTFDHLEPDAAGLQYLENKVDAILPTLRQESALLSQWAGIRVGTPNRLPIIGPHPKLKGQWVFTGLGSKGLLYSAYLGQLLAANLVSGDKIPMEVSTQRLNSDRA
jgi:glycine/D-amino acid oxidase-like deaminating enzyme